MSITNIEFEKDELMGAVEGMKRNYGSIIEYIVLNAKLKKEAYDAYLDQGFTEDQAIELVRCGVFDVR